MPDWATPGVKRKYIINEEKPCPHCGGIIKIEAFKETIKPAQAAETRIVTRIEKAVQKSITDFPKGEN